MRQRSKKWISSQPLTYSDKANLETQFTKRTCNRKWYSHPDQSLHQMLTFRQSSARNLMQELGKMSGFFHFNHPAPHCTQVVPSPEGVILRSEPIQQCRDPWRVHCEGLTGHWFTSGITQGFCPVPLTITRHSDGAVGEQSKFTPSLYALKFA